MDKNLGILVTAIVMLIIGVSLIGVLATQGNAVTERSYQTDTIDKSTAYSAGLINESIHMALSKGDQTGWRSEYSECLIPSIVVKNATTTFANGGCAPAAANGDYYYVQSDSYFVFCNKTALVTQPNSSITASYNYCADTYITQGFGRTAIDTTMGLFAIALFGGALWMFYALWKNVSA